MSLTFRKHHFDLSQYAWCPICSAPIVQMDEERECLYEWLADRCQEQEVVYIVPLPKEIPENEWAAVGVVLKNGFMLPVDKACLDYDYDCKVSVNERLIGLEVIEVTWVVMGEEGGKPTAWACVVDLSTPKRKHVVTLACNIDILMYQLTDELFRRVEP